MNVTAAKVFRGRAARTSAFRLVATATLIAALATVWPVTAAQAYLDPGTGSLILQTLLGGVAGALVVGRLYWYRLKTLFWRNAPANEKPEDD